MPGPAGQRDRSAAVAPCPSMAGAGSSLQRMWSVGWRRPQSPGVVGTPSSVRTPPSVRRSSPAATALLLAVPTVTKDSLTFRDATAGRPGFYSLASDAPAVSASGLRDPAGW